MGRSGTSETILYSGREAQIIYRVWEERLSMRNKKLLEWGPFKSSRSGQLRKSNVGV